MDEDATLEVAEDEEHEEEEAVAEDEIDDEANLVPPPYPLPPGAIWAMALWDYDAVEDGELTFREHDFVVVTSTPEGGWWEGFLPGVNDDTIGMFPSNYVEPR